MVLGTLNFDRVDCMNVDTVNVINQSLKDAIAFNKQVIDFETNVIQSGMVSERTMQRLNDSINEREMNIVKFERLKKLLDDVQLCPNIMLEQ